MMVLERDKAQRLPLKPELRIIGRETVTMRSIKRRSVLIDGDQGRSSLASSLANAPAKAVSAPTPDASSIVERDAPVVSAPLAYKCPKQTEPAAKRKSGWFSRFFGEPR